MHVQGHHSQTSGGPGFTPMDTELIPPGPLPEFCICPLRLVWMAARFKLREGVGLVVGTIGLFPLDCDRSGDVGLRSPIMFDSLSEGGSVWRWSVSSFITAALVNSEAGQVARLTTAPKRAEPDRWVWLPLLGSLGEAGELPSADTGCSTFLPSRCA